MLRIIALSFMFFCWHVAVAAAEDVREVTWQDLVPQLPAAENPLAGMTEEEAGWVEWIIYLRNYLPEEILPRNEEFHKELNDALPKLQEQGIDIDKIIADRKYQNSAVNTELDGKRIRLAGYLLPLDFSGNAIKEFLLVPFIGACIHVPPPPPNQIVYAETKRPTPYNIEELFKPLVLTGRLEIQSLSKELFLVDGSDNISIGYHMFVESMEEYTEGNE